MNETRSRSDIGRAIARAQAHSPFLRLQLERFPDIASQLACGHLADALQAARAQGETGEAMAAIGASGVPSRWRSASATLPACFRSSG
jgi:hypothetical protein